MAHLALQRPVTKRKTDSSLRSVLMALNELYFLFLSYFEILISFKCKVGGFGKYAQSPIAGFLGRSLILSWLWLLRPDATPFQGILEALFVVVGDGDVFVAKDDATSLDDADLLRLDDEGAMHTHKAIRREHLL